MTNSQLERYYKGLHTEKQFDKDIEDIIASHSDYLNSIYDDIKENTLDVYKEVFNFFLHEKILHYEQDDTVYGSLLFAVTETIRLLDCSRNPPVGMNTIEDQIIENIKLYFNEFSYPELDETDSRSVLIHEILSLEDSNIYKQKLNYALLHSLYNHLSDVLSGILNDAPSVRLF